MADDTLRRNLDRAFDPGPDFPHRLLMSRTIAMLYAEVKTGGRGQERRMPHLGQPWALALVAALITVAIVATLVVGARLLHSNAPIPAKPEPVRPTTFATCDTQTGLVPVVMLSPTTGWAHGALRTTDGGLSWHDMSPPSLPNSWNVSAECFLDSNRAWTTQAVRTGTSAADHIVTFATTDGGRTWQQSAQVELGIRLCAHPGFGCAGGWVEPHLHFIDARQGWLLVLLGHNNDQGSPVSQGPADLYTTADGGLHWTMVSRSGSADGNAVDKPCQPILLGVTFVSPTTGWGQTCSPDGPALLVTHDGGVTWKLQRLPSALVNGCPCETPLPVFFNDKQGLLLGDNVLLATSDGGSTWVERSLPPRITSCCGDAVWRYFQVNFLDANTGWAIAPPQGWTKGSPVRDWLYRTRDGGQTWTLSQKDLPLGYTVTALLIVDVNNGFALGQGNAVGSGDELVKTSDGGHTWKVVNSQIQGT